MMGMESCEGEGETAPDDRIVEDRDVVADCYEALRTLAIVSPGFEEVEKARQAMDFELVEAIKGSPAKGMNA